MIQYNWYKFSELSLNQLYSILATRAEVFVVDQKCQYQDPDGKDSQAIHLLGTEGGHLQAYLRLFPPSTPSSPVVFGRVLTARSARSKGYGKLLIEELLKYCQANYPSANITCSAQHYLLHFYESFGFKALGEIYDDVGIPHIDMVFKN
ncbi:GNAT family N-acetyltransferase [Legionella waltersii]|uniref:GNAT family acetyltransferase n=1 Tax=Legionella waltersii TaxID=66969 RepID=A0A0W1ANN1_9GAMM|nr:GNAT family N-acetyltransferase [Legionella waltersii]KTD82935.1 GNAT family acetyltransferase [Legionella waltersii]SNV02401.1 acyltransferase [Legionella waltersii]